ncbi:helix-turn-helix domain-containing protein [Streptomyces lusitanus]|uniref:AraC family transcriptional regulator n=1 Tax=Streptomyces lusitanus TaxID=68232 RepID=A0ABU3JZW3_9ACTN|nr:AraC family transcriptional regulator [Streptomyces lusitanus]
MDAAVERAVARMRERFGDPLTVTDVAHGASLGDFPFSRLFREETGVSPGRFLAAVRVHEAKKLIGSTSMTFAEISAAVGFDSLDAFTHSFTAAVGLSPGRFRRLCGAQGAEPPAPEPGPSPRFGSVAGTVRLPPGHGNARVFLGAFATAVVQYPAVAQAVVDVPSDRPSCYSLRDVPEGRWHLLAVAVAAGTGHDPHAVRTGLVGGHGTAATTVTVTAGAVTSAAVRLRPACPADPPVLLALPELDPPATVVPHPGCAATTPAAAAPGREPAGAGRLRLVPAAPVPPGA